MPNLIELNYYRNNALGNKVTRTLVNIDSIAIINDLGHSDPNIPQTEVRIAGGGTVQCMETYDAIKFLIGMKSE